MSNSFKVFVQSKQTIPQSQPLREDQVVNNADGYVWQTDPWMTLRRFLILGTEGGTYYASQRQITKDAIGNSQRCLVDDPTRFVDTIVEISDKGKAYKNDPALYLLAMATADSRVDARRYAFAHLSKVARTGTHLYHFLEFVQQFRGWGRGLRRAVANWYLDRPLESLSHQLAKYRQRDGWSHRDALRLSHPKPGEQKALFQWAVGKPVDEANLVGLTRGKSKIDCLLASGSLTSDRLVKLVGEYHAPFEVLPTDALNDPAVWQAMLPNLGLTAIIRNLGNMASKSVFNDAEFLSLVCSRITNTDEIRKARVHPIQMLAALRTYGQGHGERSKNTWQIYHEIEQALNIGFERSFEAVEPVGKRLLIALDVSSSMMGGVIAGIPGLTPREASAALAMVIARKEKDYNIIGFCDRLVRLPIHPMHDFRTVMKTISGLPFGGTDCSLPMLGAMKNNEKYDGFVIITDNETWAGGMHPSEALQLYRQKMNIPARLVTIGMTATSFTIADPRDPGMLDVVGFSTDTPLIMADFLRGEI